MSFGDRFKKARENKKFSQQDLADLLGVTDGTISNYEKGVAFPRWESMKKSCDILGVDPNYLFWDDLDDSLKDKIMDEMTFTNTDTGIQLYKQLDPEDKAEIRGEMKQMLKAEKYQASNSFTEKKRRPFSGARPAQVAAYGQDVTGVDNK